MKPLKTKRAYYMTSEKWAKIAIAERRLKLSRFYESNDPFELNLFDSRDQSDRLYVKLLNEYFDKNVGMICFGVTNDAPAMWAHYADKHKGVCLGFDIEAIQLTPVTYTDAKLKFRFDPDLPNAGLAAPDLQRILLTKSTTWSYEAEHRVLAGLKVPDPSNGLYYVDFGAQTQLREVLIGHRCPWTTLQAAAAVGEVEKPVRIVKVRPAFGRFAMVEQHLVPPVVVEPRKLKK
jgi:hypothetical protein